MHTCNYAIEYGIPTGWIKNNLTGIFRLQNTKRIYESNLMMHEICDVGAKSEIRREKENQRWYYIIVNQAQNTEKYKCKIHTTETEATRSYIIIPASARARLAHDMTTGRSPATSSTIILLLKT